MDDTGDGRWLTYAELAVIRGINRESAVKLVQRERWPRSSGNDRAKTVRVLVPGDWLQPAKERLPSSRDQVGGSGEYAGMLAAIEAAHASEVSALRGEITALKTLADATGVQLADARERADRATARTAGLEADSQSKDSEIATLRDAVGGMRDTVAWAESRAVHAEQRATEADARIEQAKAQLAGLGAKVARLNEAEAEASEQRTVADQARAAAQEAVQAAVELRGTVEELKAGQAMMQDIHARDLEQAQRDAQAAQEAVEALREAEEARKARGRWSRLRAAWRGEW